MCRSTASFISIIKSFANYRSGRLYVFARSNRSAFQIPDFDDYIDNISETIITTEPSLYQLAAWLLSLHKLKKEVLYLLPFRRYSTESRYPWSRYFLIFSSLLYYSFRRAGQHSAYFDHVTHPFGESQSLDFCISNERYSQGEENFWFWRENSNSLICWRKQIHFFKIGHATPTGIAQSWKFRTLAMGLVKSWQGSNRQRLSNCENSILGEGLPMGKREVGEDCVTFVWQNSTLAMGLANMNWLGVLGKKLEG